MGIEALFFSFFSGAYTKLADSSRSRVAPFYGFVGGFLGYIIAHIPGVSNIVVGTVIGNILAGKVDKLPHYVLAATMLFLLCVLPVELELIPLALFTTAAYLDERFSKRKGILGKRILLPFTIVVLTPLIGILPLLVMVAWEAGYRATSYLVERRKGINSHK